MNSRSLPQSPKKSIFQVFSGFTKKHMPLPNELDSSKPARHFEINNKEDLNDQIFELDIDAPTQQVQSQPKPAEQTEDDDGIIKLVVKVSVLYQNENKQLQPYSKSSIMQYPPQSAFKVIKIPKVYRSFIEYLKGQVERYIIIDGGWVYVVKKIKADQFKVCSVTDLKLLQTVLLTTKDGRHFFLIDFSNRKSKTYNFQKQQLWNLFLIKLNSEIQRLGLEIGGY